MEILRVVAGVRVGESLVWYFWSSQIVWSYREFSDMHYQAVTVWKYGVQFDQPSSLTLSGTAVT